MNQFNEVLAQIKRNPKRWLWGALAIVAEKILEHRVLAWANERIDEGATFVIIPQLRDLLKAASDHPLLSVFVMAAAYSVGMVAVAHITAFGRFRRGRQYAPRLEFGLIHAGTWGSDAFAQSLVVDIRNSRIGSVNTAENVTARIRFIHNDGTTSFTITSAAWLTEKSSNNGIVQGGITSSTNLEAGEEQPFVLLLVKTKDRSVWAFQNLAIPVGVCGVGHWIADVRVISDNAQTLEGSIGFHVFRGNELQFDQPTAFLSRSDR